MNKELIFGAAACTIVLSGTVLAFTVTGSPVHQRSIALDERRLDDIEQLGNTIQARYDKEPLPRALPPNIAKSDPETNKPYEYRRLSKTAYQLCAHFDNAQDDWRNHHTAGRVCFRYDKKDPA